MTSPLERWGVCLADLGLASAGRRGWRADMPADPVEFERAQSAGQGTSLSEGGVKSAWVGPRLRQKGGRHDRSPALGRFGGSEICP